MKRSTYVLDDLDMAIMASLQRGIKIIDRPYSELAEQLSLSQEEILYRIRRLQTNGIIRRYGAAVSPSKMGFKANGMVVCKVHRSRVPYVGKTLSRLNDVTHCYERKTVPKIWSYNLFFMIHSSTRRSAEELVAVLAKKLRITKYEILFSVKELKKTSIPLLQESD